MKKSIVIFSVVTNKRSSAKGNWCDDLHFVLAVNPKSNWQNPILPLMTCLKQSWLPRKCYHSNQIIKSTECFQRLSDEPNINAILIGSWDTIIPALSVGWGWDGMGQEIALEIQYSVPCVGSQPKYPFSPVHGGMWLDVFIKVAYMKKIGPWASCWFELIPLAHSSCFFSSSIKMYCQA